MNATALIGSALMLSTIAAAPAAAQDWVMGGLGETAAQFYDQPRVRVSGQKRMVWVLTVHSRSQSLGGNEPYDYTLARTEFDCYNGSSRWIAVRSYVFSRETPTFSHDGEGDWQSITPGSIVETTADLVCSGEQQESLSATSPHETASRARAVLWPSD